MINVTLLRKGPAGVLGDKVRTIVDTWPEVEEAVKNGEMITRVEVVEDQNQAAAGYAAHVHVTMGADWTPAMQGAEEALIAVKGMIEGRRRDFQERTEMMLAQLAGFAKQASLAIGDVSPDEALDGLERYALELFANARRVGR